MAIIEINWQPSDRDLRVFAIVQLIVAGVGAWLIHRRLHWDQAAMVLVALSLLLLVAGFVRPRILWPLFVGWMVAAFPIGWVMSHLLLAIVYFGIVTPIGCLLRLRGRDALQLKADERTSYWNARPASPDSAQYFRQF